MAINPLHHPPPPDLVASLFGGGKAPADPDRRNPNGDPTMPDFQPNPSLFREMAEPFPDKDAANAALDAFWKGVGELRKQHRIRDVFVVVAVSEVHPDGDTETMGTFSFGDSSHTLALAAYGFGAQKAQHDQHVEDLLVKAAKGERKRK